MSDKLEIMACKKHGCLPVIQIPNDYFGFALPYLACPVCEVEEFNETFPEKVIAWNKKQLESPSDE